MYVLAFVIAILAIICGSLYLYAVHNSDSGLNDQKTKIAAYLDKKCFVDEPIN